MYLAQNSTWGHSPNRIEIWKCWFLRIGEVTWEKPLGARTRTNNKLNPHVTPCWGIEPGPHWWEASSLTTASYLHPAFVHIWLRSRKMIAKWELCWLGHNWGRGFWHQFDFNIFYSMPSAVQESPTFRLFHRTGNGYLHLSPLASLILPQLLKW